MKRRVIRQNTLASSWTGLNEALLGRIYPVEADGRPRAGSPDVAAPLTDATLELTANWQSPFEQSGAESRMPAISAMLQSGTLQSYAQLSFLGLGSDDGIRARLAQEVIEFSKNGQGRSGMTKMNSTQVFNGAAPAKISMTLHFRAFSEPTEEVSDPIDQLARWTLAKQLAANGSIVQAIQNFRQGQGFLSLCCHRRRRRWWDWSTASRPSRPW